MQVCIAASIAVGDAASSTAVLANLLLLSDLFSNIRGPYCVNSIP
jgi:hypothetical protein